MTSFNSNNQGGEAQQTAPATTFDANILAARAIAATQATQQAPAMGAADAQEAATLAVMNDIISERLGGDPRLAKRWLANNESFFKYRVGLKAAELQGKTGGDVVDTERLAKGVRASMAGGELRRNGEAKGMREGTSIEVQQVERPRIIRLPNGGLLDTHTNVTVSKATAAKLGWTGDQGAKQ